MFQVVTALANKHLVLAVGLIDGLWHGRNQHFEAPAKARHNRGEFTSRLYNLRMYEVSGHCNLPVRSVNRPAY
jgi:hypothetical protein